jgi:hypothetical protein
MYVICQVYLCAAGLPPADHLLAMQLSLTSSSSAGPPHTTLDNSQKKKKGLHCANQQLRCNDHQEKTAGEVHPTQGDANPLRIARKQVLHTHLLD